ncbi:MAG TPA: hypothetical protein DD661_08210, partial [Gammaproteobacteria bacterium]|nr:hypothetical protein [Gammaproteobacteria bacterium]
APDLGKLQLTARGQGCNDPVGVCYAPIAHTVALTLPETTAGQSSAINSVTDLQQLLGVAASGPEFLAAEEAFRLEARSDRRDTLIAQFFVAPGYYLYRDKLRFEMLAGATLEEHALPPGVSKQDPYFGEVTIFPADFTAELPIVADAAASEVRLIAHFQGCAEQGICYPPAKKTLLISLPSIISDAAASENPNLSASAEAGNNTEPAKKEAVSTQALVGYLGAAFGTGLLLSFTPCVLPLIPILLGTIVGQSGAGRGRATALSVVYVLGTVATYAVIGAVAGATG